MAAKRVSYFKIAYLFSPSRERHVISVKCDNCPRYFKNRHPKRRPSSRVLISLDDFLLSSGGDHVIDSIGYCDVIAAFGGYNDNALSPMTPDEANVLISHFLQFCRECDLVNVEKYLEENYVDVDCRDDDGNTPLQISAAYGYVELTELLLANGADVKLCNSYRYTPLLHAAYNGHAEILSILIKHGASVHSANAFGATALVLAAKKGHTDVVKLLLDTGADAEPSSAYGDFEASPLVLAAIYDHEPVVRLLLDSGADASRPVESTGYTPLMFAALNSQLTLVQLLLDRGADADIKNTRHQTAFDLAVCRRRNDVKALLEQYTTATRSRTSTMVAQRPKLNIIDAVKAEDTSRIKEILQKDPVQSDYVRPEDGCTPLMLASMLGRLDIVTLLVKKGAALDRQDKLKGWTSLMQAAFFSKVPVAKFLIHSGANVKIRTYDGFTALELAAIADYTDVAEDGLLALLSKKEELYNAHSSSMKNLFGGFFARRFRYAKPKRPVSKPKEWWSRFKNRFRSRSSSVGSTYSMSSMRRNIPLGHESCIFVDPSKSVLNTNLVFGSTREIWKSQSVCDLHNLRSNAPKSPDPVWGLTTRNYDYLEGKPGVVVPPFHPIMTFGPTDPKTKKRPHAAVVDGEERRHSIFLANSLNSLDFNSINNNVSATASRICITSLSASPESVTSSVPADPKSVPPPSTPTSTTGGTCESDYGGHRSLAMYNASRMRPPKPRPVEPLSFAKYDNFIASLNLQPTVLSANGQKCLIPSPNSSLSTNSSNFLPPPPQRKKTPHFAVNVNSQGAPRKKSSRGVLARPHSYHDAVTENRIVNSVTSSQIVGVRRIRGTQTLNTRPHSYHDPDAANLLNGLSYNDLSLTPTMQKTFGFFNTNNSVAPYKISKFSSTPHLMTTTSPSNSTSDSSSVTQSKKTSQVVNPTAIGQNFPSTDTLKLDEDYMDYILKQIAAEPYSQVFDDEEMDLDTLITLTDGDLRDLGIQDPGPRNEILKIVREVNFLIERKRKRRQAENNLQ